MHSFFNFLSESSTSIFFFLPLKICPICSEIQELYSIFTIIQLYLTTTILSNTVGFIIVSKSSREIHSKFPEIFFGRNFTRGGEEGGLVIQVNYQVPCEASRRSNTYEQGCTTRSLKYTKIGHALRQHTYERLIPF